MPKWLSVTLLAVGAVIFLIILISTIANIMFDKKVKKDISELFSTQTENKKEIIQREDLKALPAPVQRWLENSKIIGNERVKTVRLKQKGLMRTKGDGPWMPAEAEQYFTVDEPGFVWKVKVNMAPLVYFAGKDKYYQGKGTMNIKVLSLINVVDAKGPEMDQGTLLRYLAEIAWFPTGALSKYIKWEPIDDQSAKAIMSYKGVTESAVFTFNDQGDIVDFTAKRYRELNGGYVLDDWGGMTKEYKEFNGIRIPNKTDVMWKLKTGDFTWYKVEVTDVEYNKPFVY